MQRQRINESTAQTRFNKCKLGLMIAFLVTLTQALPSGASAQDGAPLRRTIRSHWVRPNEDGNVEGRISALEMNSTIPLEQLDITLVKNGEKLYTETTDSEGKFSFSDVTPDIYTLIASGKNGFMAYGIEVVPRPEGGILDLDFGKRDAAEKAFYAKLGLPAGAAIQDDLQIDAAAIPPTFNTMQRLTQTFLQSAGVFAADVKAIGNAEEVSGGFQYALSDDGSFKGKLQPIGTKDGEAQNLSDMNIFLIQDDKEIGRVPVEENGNFELKDVEPGVYAIVAAGKDGFAALSMELVGSKGGDVNVAPPQRGIFNTAARIKQVDLPAIGIAIVTDAADIQVIQQEIQRVNDLNQPAAENLNQSVVDNSVGLPPQFGSDGFAPGSSASSGGFGGSPGAPVGSASAPANFAPTNSFPSGPAGPGGFGPSVGRSSFVGSRISQLAILGAIPGIIAIADDDDEDNPPVAASPSSL
ncbi:carboxypeptidase-like regulatory domain-containing protein [Mariniblastus sp.]|nr:carboxypeptidase-like regulatory domain-containing protein [Mariniblastus sp.]